MAKKKKGTKGCRAMAAVAFLFAGCAGMDPGYVAFVHAERATKKAVASEWSAYVQADATKTPAQKADARLLVEEWERSLAEAEKRVGGK